MCENPNNNKTQTCARILFSYKAITAASKFSYLKASQHKSPEAHAIEHTLFLPRYTGRCPSMYKIKNKAVNGEAGGKGK